MVASRGNLMDVIGKRIGRKEAMAAPQRRRRSWFLRLLTVMSTLRGFPLLFLFSFVRVDVVVGAGRMPPSSGVLLFRGGEGGGEGNAMEMNPTSKFNSMGERHHTTTIAHHQKRFLPNLFRRRGNPSTNTETMQTVQKPSKTKRNMLEEGTKKQKIQQQPHRQELPTTGLGEFDDNDEDNPMGESNGSKLSRTTNSPWVSTPQSSPPTQTALGVAVTALSTLRRALGEICTSDRVFLVVRCGLVYLTMQSLWKAILEQYEKETAAYAERNESEEHDRLRFSAESVDHAVRVLIPRQRRQQQQQLQTDSQDQSQNDKRNDSPSLDDLSLRVSRRVARDASQAVEIANRLSAVGLPLVSGEDGDRSQVQRAAPSVEGILRGLTVTEAHLLADTLVVPSALDGRDDATVSPWHAIGGLVHVKEAMLDLVFSRGGEREVGGTHRGDNGNNNDNNNNNAFDFDDYGGLLRKPSGLMLYGPPGCGKTMMARALARHVRTLAVTPSTFFRKYVGESNLRTKALFSLARRLRPCVIFVDEMDAVFRERHSGNDHVSDAALRELQTEFLQQWDRSSSSSSSLSSLNGMSSGDVTVLGATNRPWDVDPAFARRMPSSFYVGLPDRDSRVEVLRTVLHRVPLAPGFDWVAIADRTEGYSGSDLRELLRMAATLGPWRESGRRRGTKLRPLTTDDVLRATAGVRPTQWSAAYASSLAEFRHRAVHGRGLPPPHSSLRGDHPMDHGSHRRDDVNVEQDDREEEEDDESTSFDDDDDDDDFF